MKTFTGLLMIGLLSSSEACLAITVLFSAEHLALDAISPKSKTVHSQCNILKLLEQKAHRNQSCVSKSHQSKIAISRRYEHKTQPTPRFISQVEYQEQGQQPKVLAADIAAIYMYR